ncbi:MAG: gluconate 2-dehydrogenase subunit 3 family protein [Gammaproteobacteria bacterium]|nr:gluconate 2-dehydrogenase subunit 3 family protein [Gammaproteobacteria bacterium]MDE2262427.1 gluconate 2-dehydrogenase subunit 3 family protein [Gammaproteobacteria bacterium]
MTDRRTTLKLVIAAAAAMPALRARANYRDNLEPGASEPGDVRRFEPTIHGYGPDPDLIKAYEKGAFWPLTMNAGQRQLAAALCDLIIPADEHSPSASAVGAVDFIDEWISAPYPKQREDRDTVLNGFVWLDGEARRRFEQPFAKLHEAQQRTICDRICDASRAAADLRGPAQFFAAYRNLTAAGFYTTLAGRKDLQYIGNVALTHFDGAPVELLRKLGLA